MAWMNGDNDTHSRKEQDMRVDEESWCHGMATPPCLSKTRELGDTFCEWGFPKTHSECHRFFNNGNVYD
ncbi:hypothetical protein TNCT_614241 [Trichonephila clavata]|uniref:Uncharacterized protein n=1 Tax=Trichonephila clavata TaxID=2740835 RepID=A0A8X6IND2_TRICU|nr:hypothetical protein TNCT_614241 [Trichonephila clavata]